MKKHESHSADIAIYIENLCGVSWYTADPETPWLVKAAASVEFGYQMLLTDLENTYFCAGDVDLVKFEKKVREFCVQYFSNTTPQ